MSSLASLLVRDQALPTERVQEAIQLQVTRGGNLDTVLLEMGALSENEMNAYCAAVWGLLPGSREEVMSAPLSTTRVLPREFAVRHRVIPVARTEDTVVLAVDRPLAEAGLREIAMELGVDPTQRIVCTLRIEVGLAQHYDIRLTSRMRELKERLDREDPGSIPYVAPFDGVPTRSSLPPRQSSPSSAREVSTTPPPYNARVQNDASPWTTAPTAPPPPPAEVAALNAARERSPSSAPTKKTSVPAGAFEQSSPGLRPPRPANSRQPGFLDATRYIMPSREAEVLGRSEPSFRRPSKPPTAGASNGPSEAPDPSSGWRSAPRPSQRNDRSIQSWRSRSAPPDLGRYDDDRIIVHDVVHRGANAPLSAPPSAAAKPQKPRSSTVPPESELSLPSVILDVDDEVEQQVAALRSAGPEDEVMVLPLLSAGEAALPALAREFPGRLWFDRHEPHSKLSDGRNVSPIARAFVAFGEMAVPYVASLVEHSDTETRYYACLLASEFIHPELVRPVGKRIFDPDAGVRAAAFRALSVLTACTEEFDELAEMLRSTARDPHNAERQLVAIEALGRLRDVGSFEFLITMLTFQGEEVVRAAHASLVRLSGQDFGTSTKKWTLWHEKHGSKHRIEWLIEALMHSDVRLRRRASDELKHLTQEYFGYHPTLPRRDRERARRKYLTWWQQLGWRIFSGDSPAVPGQVEDE